ncbi:MAG TPA: anti-sigma F factor [Firmicutes bacterium]|uniref:Anti-sigma F factor n=1 Tax=Capillibacterium thermochitinicola TaxID=2699427 RepID=A0A8J6LJA0_9FIRM|nr:anti-sigma F factor [Capillibacterium thermochitinicola]MBA2133606.1 anti-sigma F factor [Capillibacterium thermochitinicola]HHW12378.1 anti-sigma F factor [Bacillota bacterium]
MKENYLNISFPSLPDNVSLSRVIVASFAAQLDFTLNELEEIRVATSEAVSNCVIHAYPDHVGEVRLELKIKDDTLMIEVIDEGCGIQDLDLAKTPAYSTDPERMGLGLVFMESFMDEMTIESQPNQGTKVLMVKKPERSKNSSHDCQ